MKSQQPYSKVIIGRLVLLNFVFHTDQLYEFFFLSESNTALVRKIIYKSLVMQRGMGIKKRQHGPFAV